MAREYPPAMVNYDKGTKVVNVVFTLSAKWPPKQRYYELASIEHTREHPMNTPRVAHAWEKREGEFQLVEHRQREREHK